MKEIMHEKSVREFARSSAFIAEVTNNRMPDMGLDR